MIEFLFGIVVGAFVCYIVLRERIKLGKRLLIAAAIITLIVISLGALTTLPITIHQETKFEETQPPYETLPLPEWLEEKKGNVDENSSKVWNPLPTAYNSG